MLNNLLIYRFVLLNVAYMLFLGFAWDRGLVDWAIKSDSTGITWFIAALFVLATLGCGYRIIRTASDLNALKLGKKRKAGDSKAKAFAKIEWLSDAVNHLATLGLLGTIIGFIIALSAIDISSMGNASGIKGNVSEMLSGVYIALSTTAVGTILALAHDMNMRVLKTAMNCYWADVEV